MSTPPFLVEVPSDDFFLDDHCANCLESLPEDAEGLFCSSWCSEIADSVRYMRRVFRDGRIENREVQLAVQTRNAFLLIGGYRALGRTLQPEVRSQVKVRAGGRCQQCGKVGTEIDHISGSSGALENLQLLCGECHRGKTAEQMVPTTAREGQLLQDLFRTRVVPDVPRLLADDQLNWQSRWRELKTARKQRFLDQVAETGFDHSGLKTRAEILLARDEFLEGQETGDPRAEDDDASQGTATYLARAMQEEWARTLMRRP